MKKLGKKIYRSSSILTVKIIAVLIFSILFLNLNFQTLTSAEFNQFISEQNIEKVGKISQVLKFHWVYPDEYLFFFITVFLPAIYYGFVRGVSFHERGVLINKGLPFFNSVVLYDQILHYEIIHPKFFLAIRQKDTGDDILFTVNDVDRVLAILDQNNISGDLGVKAKRDASAHQKLLIFFMASGVMMALIQYSGFIRGLFR